MGANPLDALPPLRFRTAFSNLEPSVRGATIAACTVVPAALIGLFLWLLPGRDIFDDRLLWLLLISAVVTPAVFGTTFAHHTLTLTPAEIDYKELRKRRRVATRDVALIATIRHPRRVIFVVLGRAGEGVVFGPGLTKAEQEATKSWLQSLSASVGVEFRQDVPLQEAMTIFSRMRK